MSSGPLGLRPYWGRIIFGDSKVSENPSNSNNCPRLIEVALPVREISAESVRDKNIHHAHISHLHIWWARRPLAASRAVVFASLVPDPDDPRCPADFRAAVRRYLEVQVPTPLRHYRRGREHRRDEDPYRPYDGVDDTPRNRLLMFIAKFLRSCCFLACPGLERQ